MIELIAVALFGIGLLLFMVCLDVHFERRQRATDAAEIGRLWREEVLPAVAADFAEIWREEFSTGSVGLPQPDCGPLDFCCGALPVSGPIEWPPERKVDDAENMRQ